MPRIWLNLSLLLLLGVIISACASPITPAQPAQNEASLRQTVEAQVRATLTASAPASAAAASATATTEMVSAAPEASTEASATPTAEVDESSPSAASSASAEPDASAEASLSATASYTDVLGPEYAKDSDGNSVPDFIETELGYDPLKDDCTPDTCGAGVDGKAIDRNSRVLLLFDSSGSMAAQLASGPKIDAAKEAVRRYTRFVSKIGQVGILVYGHKGNNTDAGRPESCQGVDVLAPMGQATGDNVDQLLGQFQPTGWTPIAKALEKAPEAWAGTPADGQPKRIIIVSDGLETCDGDPVAVAKQLHDNVGFDVEINVVGFTLQEAADVDQMKAIAAAGGGAFYEAQTAADIERYFQEQGKAYLDTLGDLVCAMNAESNTRNCDTDFYLKVSEAIQKKQEGLDYFSEKSQAYRRLDETITAWRDRREKLYDDLSNKLDQVDARRQEIEQQYRESFENVNP